MDAALTARLQDLVRREGRLLLRYVSESFPWSTAHDQDVRAAVLRFAERESDALGKLARHLQTVHVAVPHPGSYPMSFTTVNFVSLSYLLPRLAEEQKSGVAEVERLCNVLPDGETRNLVGQLLVLKKQHLSQLNNFAATSPPSMAS